MGRLFLGNRDSNNCSGQLSVASPIGINISHVSATGFPSVYYKRGGPPGFTCDPTSLSVVYLFFRLPFLRLYSCWLGLIHVFQ